MQDLSTEELSDGSLEVTITDGPVVLKDLMIINTDTNEPADVTVTVVKEGDEQDVYDMPEEDLPQYIEGALKVTIVPADNDAPIIVSGKICSKGEPIIQ